MSMYEYLYRCIRRDIVEGRIAPGQRLPSKRTLASHLGVSSITVAGAYAQLLAEGYITSVERSGYYAGAVQPSSLPRARFATDASIRKVHVGRAGQRDLVADFSGSAARTGLFPYKLWARAMREVLSAESEQTLVEASGAVGSSKLRQVLARYLRDSRGMDVSPDQIVVGAGAQTLYALMVQLLGRQRRFAIENPGYARLARVYESNDVRLSYVRLDEEGMRVDDLRKSCASVAHCMPSHQMPSGLVMSAGRRYELLSWACEGDRYIIEDDYDCEFRMQGLPIPALASMDSAERVIYANTFTKSLGPTFRIAYMVLPPRLMQRYSEHLGFYSCTVGAIEQLTLARIIETGEYERHVSRQRNYARRVQDALIDALREGDARGNLAFRNVGAGLHFVMEVHGGASEDEIAKRSLALGVKLSPLGDYWLDGSRGSGCTAQFAMNLGGIELERISETACAIGRAASVLDSEDVKY